MEIADYHSDGTLAQRFVNGTQYVDERVALIEGEAGEADTFYYLLQELFTVTGLVEKNGALAEAAVYDGYGKVRLWDYSPGDFDRDGDVDATDQTTFTTAMGLGAPGTPTPDPSTDLDMDGDTDLTDAGLFNTIKNAGGAVAERFVSSLGNPFHFTGRRLYMLETLPEADATPVANQQLQHNRARHYSPLEGRWLQRDLIGLVTPVDRIQLSRSQGPIRFIAHNQPPDYIDGLNLYEYSRAGPLFFADPAGLAAVAVSKSSCDICCELKRTTTYWGDPGCGADGAKVIEEKTISTPPGRTKAQACKEIEPAKRESGWGYTSFSMWHFRHSGPCDEPCHGQPKVPIWVCTRPTEHPALRPANACGAKHTYICCDAPNGINCRNFWQNPNGKTLVSAEALTTGTCSQVLVCPDEKTEKCSGQNYRQDYDLLGYNCGSWAHDYGNVPCPRAEAR
ncbi:MAG: hypothetical protein FLDDKLPJ_03315 [Phycisphaerae bacterium]|nr:hypothetical protein [Phycisphaerae bacterium]